MEDPSTLIPAHCLDCPFITPLLDERRNLESEESILVSPSMNEYMNQDVIDARLAAIDELLDSNGKKIRDIHALTIGCAGVRLVVATKEIHCQSPLR